MSLTNAEIAALFQEADVRIVGNRSLRVPQVDGHQAAVEFFESGGHRAVERIPVGCGKSGLITASISSMTARRIRFG